MQKRRRAIAGSTIAATETLLSKVLGEMSFQER